MHTYLFIISQWHWHTQPSSPSTSFPPPGCNLKQNLEIRWLKITILRLFHHIGRFLLLRSWWASWSLWYLTPTMSRSAATLFNKKNLHCTNSKKTKRSFRVFFNSRRSTNLECVWHSKSLWLFNVVGIFGLDLACSGRCCLTSPNVWWKQLKSGLRGT